MGWFGAKKKASSETREGADSCSSSDDAAERAPREAPAPAAVEASAGFAPPARQTAAERAAGVPSAEAAEAAAVAAVKESQTCGVNEPARITFADAAGKLIRGGGQMVGVIEAARKHAQELADAAADVAIDLDAKARRKAQELAERAGDLDARAVAEFVGGGDELEACRGVLEAVRKLHATLGEADTPVGPVDLAKGLGAYARQQPPKPCDSDAPVENAEHLERWLALSAISYGRFINWSLGLFKGARAVKQEDAWLAAAADQYDCSVLLHNLANAGPSNMYESAYTVFDARGDERTLVVGIRGTSNIREALADLVCKPVAIDSNELFPQSELKGTAYVHDGMWRAASSLASQLREPLERLLDARPEHQVLITGHSLGAGVACLLCLLWRPWLGERVRAVGFATPQVLDLDSARRAGGLGVTTVIVGSDVVPRLSLCSAEALTACVARAAAERRRARAGEAGGATEAPAAGGAAAEGPPTARPPQPPTPALYPAGALLHLDRGLAYCSPRGPRYIKARRVDQEAFASIRVSRSMLVSHMQTEYMKALGSSALGPPEAADAQK